MHPAFLDDRWAMGGEGIPSNVLGTNSFVVVPMPQQLYL